MQLNKQNLSLFSWNKDIISPLSCYLFAAKISISTFSMPTHLLNMANVMLSVSVHHLSKHEVIINKLALTNWSGRKY